jgi:hypothetical protein
MTNTNTAHAELRQLAHYTKPNGAYTFQPVENIGAVKIGTEITYSWEVVVMRVDAAGVILEYLDAASEEEGQALVQSINKESPLHEAEKPGPTP